MPIGAHAVWDALLHMPVEEGEVEAPLGRPLAVGPGEFTMRRPGRPKPTGLRNAGPAHEKSATLKAGEGWE